MKVNYNLNAANLSFKNNSDTLLQKAFQKIPEDQQVAYMKKESRQRTEGWKTATVVGVMTGLASLGIALKKDIKPAKKLLYASEAFAAGFGVTDIALMLYNKYKELKS